GAGNRTNAGTLANQRVIADLPFHQQQVAAVLRQRQCILGLFGHQQVDQFQPMQVITQRQAQLQLQGDAAVGHFDLQGMAQGAQQFAAADGVGQVVLATIAAVEQQQGTAVVE